MNFWSVWRGVLNNEDLVDKVTQCLAIKGVQHSQLVINYQLMKRGPHDLTTWSTQDMERRSIYIYRIIIMLQTIADASYCSNGAAKTDTVNMYSPSITSCQGGTETGG